MSSKREGRSTISTTCQRAITLPTCHMPCVASALPLSSSSLLSYTFVQILIKPLDGCRHCRMKHPETPHKKIIFLVTLVEYSQTQIKTINYDLK